MIRSVAIKLSLLYLAIVMALSIGFSVAIYNISAHEIIRNTPVALDGPHGLYSGTTERLDFENFRDELLNASQHSLQQKLILLNVVTLIIGAAVSYALARRTLQPIEDAFEAQGRFTADASHELRTPLTAMRTTIEVGLRNPKLTLGQSKTLMQGTLEEIQKLSTLATGLLKLTRQRSGEMPSDPVNLATIAAEAMAQLALAASNKQIKIDNQTHKLTVLGDALSIKEVVVILLDNAIKYSGPDTTITLRTQAQNKFGTISVADQGEGIKASDLPHIFDRFYRADASRSRDHSVEGYGLGLSIAKNIADAHDGAIDAESTVGKGSIFTLKIPLA